MKKKILTKKERKYLKNIIKPFIEIARQTKAIKFYTRKELGLL